jgi:hypothetical protein
MPVESLWTLVISLVIYSLGITYKAAACSHRLKLADKEIDGLVMEVARIKSHQEESISRVPKLDYAVMDKLLQEHRDHINVLNKIILEMKTPTKYTAYLKEGIKPKMTLGLAKAIVNGDVVLKKDS